MFLDQRHTSWRQGFHLAQFDKLRLCKREGRQWTCWSKCWCNWCECYSGGGILIAIVRIRDFKLILGLWKLGTGYLESKLMISWPYEYVQKIGLQLNSYNIGWSDYSNLTRFKRLDDWFERSAICQGSLGRALYHHAQAVYVQLSTSADLHLPLLATLAPRM
jgi:hypothetical protein